MGQETLAEIYLPYFAFVTFVDEQNGTFNKLLLQPIWQGLIGEAI